MLVVENASIPCGFADDVDDGEVIHSVFHMWFAAIILK